MIPLTPRQKITYAAHFLKAVFRNRFQHLTPLLREHIPADSVVLDIGANVGNFTKLFAKIAHQGHVHSFEPSGYARSILTHTVKWRALRNTTIHPFGIGDRYSEENLHFPIKKKGNIGFGLAHLGDDKAIDDRKIVSERIIIKRLDDVLADLPKSPAISFIKIDIEGWELRALEGGINTLKTHRPAIMLEVNEKFLTRAGDSTEKLWRFLRDMDYQIFKLDENGNKKPADKPIPDGDILCIPRECH